MLFASPFTGGPSRQAPLCSQPKLQKGRGGLQGRQRRERAGQVGFECSNASDGRTGHRCRRSLRISTVPCRSWPRGPFARTIHSGAPSRRAKAAILLIATLRRWYHRRMAPRDQNSPSAVLAANGVLLLLLAVDVMIGSTARSGLLYSTSNVCCRRCCAIYFLRRSS